MVPQKIFPFHPRGRTRRRSARSLRRLAIRRPQAAVLAVVTQVEDDPKDNSVGLGGLPNEDGVVQLDACVMHGPTRRCGSIGAIEKIKNPSLVARALMERTNHTFLVGAGAEKFAVDEGFETTNLLTLESRLA